METVRIGKGLLIALVSIAGASLLAVAFLLGRLTGPRVVPERVVASTPRALASPVPALDLPTPLPTFGDTSFTEPAAERPATSLPLGREREDPTVPAPAPTSMPAPAERGSDPTRAAVAQYLAAVESIQPGDLGGDAQGLANEMASALVRGDTSGLDRMIRQTEAARERLAALTPPAPCAAHHRESLASLSDALEMLGSLKSAMESTEPAARLAAVASQASALRTRAEAIQKEEQSLRQRYGLAP